MSTTCGCHDLVCDCRPAAFALRRRNVLAAAAGGMLAATGLARMARAQSAVTPEAALKALMDGNARFVAGQLESSRSDLAALRRTTAAKQEPFAAVLSCADSRVPVELVFDQSIGQIFVTRVAGNVAAADIFASLEYGAVELGTKAILVLGHTNCGAVKAAMAGQPVPGQISTLYRLIQPAIARAHGDLATAVKENARMQAALLRDASPVLAPLVKQGKLEISAGYYDFASGRVTLL